MTPTAYRERVDDASSVLEWIRERLSDEERQHLALELLDATRGRDQYREVLVAWTITVLVREHPEYAPQVKEFRNLVSSGELFQGTPLQGAPEARIA